MTTVEKLLWEIDARTEGLRRELKRAEQSGDKFTKKMDRTVARTNSSFSGLGRTLSTAVVPALTAVAGALSVQALYRYSEAWKQTENRLKLVTSGTRELSATQSILFNVAQDTRTAFESTANLYSRLSRSTEDLNLSQSRLIGLTTAVNQSTRISGGGVQEATAAVIQFGQALQSGRLQGDELRSILENSPRLARALADGLGVSIGELRELGSQGELTAQKIVDALATQTGVINEEFAKLQVTGGEALTKLDNAFLRLVATIDKATGASKGFAETVTDFTYKVEILGLDESSRSVETLQKQLEGVKRSIEIFDGIDLSKRQETTIAGLERRAAFLQKTISAVKGEIQQTPQEVKIEFELSGVEVEFNEVQERIAKTRELLAEGGDDIGLLRKLNRDADELQETMNELNGGLARFRSIQFGDIENDAIGFSPVKKDEDKPADEKQLKAIERTTEALQFKADQLNRSAREQEIYNAFKQAGIEVDNQAAAQIEALAGKIYDVTEARRRQKEAEEDLRAAVEKEDEQNKAVNDVDKEIADIEREVAALLQGKEAYEAYQEARDIEQGSEAIRERLEALGLEEEIVNRVTEAYEKQSQELDKAEEVYKKREEAIEKQKQSEQELADILENGFGRSLSAAADGWDALGKVALDVLGQMIAKGFELNDAFSGSGGSSGGGGLFSGLLSGVGSGIGELFSGFFNEGGKISGPGGPRSDSILAAVSNGEYVVNAAATSKYLPLLESLNSGKLPAFANGGFVGGAVPQLADMSAPIRAINNNNSNSSSSTSVSYSIDARGAEIGVEDRIRRALDEREPLIIERSVDQVREENFRNGQYLGGN